MVRGALSADITESQMHCVRGMARRQISFTVWPCPQMATAVEEPYSTILCVHSLLEHTDLTLMLDGEALYGACLRIDCLVGSWISTLNVHRLQSAARSDHLSRAHSALTSPSSRRIGLPYCASFLPSSYAPIIAAEKAIEEERGASIIPPLPNPATVRAARCILRPDDHANRPRPFGNGGIDKEEKNWSMGTWGLHKSRVRPKYTVQQIIAL